MAEGEVIEIGECSDLADSDCEIQEDDVPVINLSEEDACHNGENREESELSQATSPAPVEESLLTISFSIKEDYLKLKSCITTAIRACLKEHGVYTCWNEDESMSICFMKTDNAPKEEKPDVKVDENEAEENDTEEDDTDGMFLIDTNPAETIEIGSIPSYKRAIKDVMDSEAKKPKLSADAADQCSRPRASQSCFNCFGKHSLRDCPEPRNQTRINKARKQFMEFKSERYHIDIEQRFAHFRPGQLTDGLRKALGLGRRELPSFIYKMRVLGYPPGWLEEAKVAHSGIALFDSEGREVMISDEEDGEVEIERHKFDPTKIITFPGFNSDPGPDFFDDFKFYGVPPLQREDCKEKFISSLGDNIVKGYKRKKLKNLSAATEPTEEGGTVIADMEIEDVVDENLECLPPLPPPLPDELNIPPPPPPAFQTPERNSTPTIETPERGSPSLEDLVAKQRALLEALENSSLTPDVTMQDDSLIDEVLELERETEAAEAANNKKPAEEKPAATGSASPKNCPSPQTPNLTNKKASIPGTPLLKFSPYDKLPLGEHFKKGVSDVLFFENLPDSIGKFEKMKDVIKKVRTVVTKLNSET